MAGHVAPWRPLPGTGQNLTLGAASVASTAVGSHTFAVRLSATGDCHVAFGPAASVAATAKDALIKSSDPPQVFAINAGGALAVIQDASATGTLNIVELSH